VLLCFLPVESLLLGNDPDWDTFKATWGPTPLSSGAFIEQPRTEKDAIKDKYQKIAGSCNGKTLGNRYMKNNDSALILLFDSQGIIAGIPIPLIESGHYAFDKQRMFNRDVINGINAYTLTAYFVNPGRDEKSLKSDGTGTGLWLQNGANPLTDSMAIPLREENIGSTKWTKGACFPSMGVHYWYDNHLDADCDTFFPSFLLFNRGKLTGFGWSVVGKFEYSKRFEYPPTAAIQSFLIPVPKCIPKRYEEAGGFTTMHLYFNTEPWNLIC
ncbi:unnamed protein product, partial [Didymodactylos carnosus]